MTTSLLKKLLLGLCGGLTVVFVLQLLNAPDIHNYQSIQTKLISEADVSGKDKTKKELADYKVITLQPLFEFSRVGVESQQQVTVITEQNTQTDVSLPRVVGIMQIKGSQTAFLLGRGATKAMAVEVGDEYLGWKVERIENTQLLLTGNGDEETITLDWVQKDALESNRSDSRTKPNVVTSNEDADKQARMPTRLKDRLQRQLDD